MSFFVALTRGFPCFFLKMQSPALTPGDKAPMMETGGSGRFRRTDRHLIL